MLLGLLALSGSRTVGAESCARAQLTGDPGAVARVTDELRRLGVTVEPAVRCRTIDATVAIEGTGIAVAIADHGRGSEGRVVGDARVAAVWIDSWLRDDYEAIEPAPVPPTAPPMAPPSTIVPERGSSASTSTSTILDRMTLAARYERDYLDHTAWSGASLDGCAHVGSVCFGGRLRGAWQAMAPVGPDAVMATRSEVSALATASVGIALGRTILSPEIGVGLGRFATTRAPQCPTPPPVPNCDPSTDPTCPAPPPSCIGPDGTAGPRGNETLTTYGPRVEAALRIAIPLFAQVWLDGTAGLSAAPLHHGSTMAPNDPTIGKLPPLPGEPLATFQVGVGIRIGAP